MILNQESFEQLLRDISACVEKHFRPKDVRPPGQLTFVEVGDVVSDIHGHVHTVTTPVLNKLVVATYQLEASRYTRWYIDCDKKIYKDGLRVAGYTPKCREKHFPEKPKEPGGVYVWPGDRVAGNDGTQYLIKKPSDLHNTASTWVCLWKITSDHFKGTTLTTSKLHQVPTGLPVLGYDLKYLKLISKAL